MQSLWMLAAGLCFALMGVFVKLGAEQFSAAEMVFYRSLLSIAVTWGLLAKAGMTVKTTRFGMHAHRGVAGFVSLFMFFYTLTVLPVATAMTLNYTSPVFLAVLLAWLARERPGGKLALTIGLGFAGAVLLLQPTLSSDQLAAGLIGLASGATSAVAYWNVRQLVQADEPVDRVVFYFALFSLMGALVWMTPTGWSEVTLDNVWVLAGVGVMGTAGQLAMTRAYGRGKTLVTATLSYSGIVFSSALGILIWHDVLGIASWLGMALIVAAGIAAVQFAPGAGPDAGPQVTND